ncbi:MAG: hypothetical protein R3F61_38505 [Myxococcota bacterium]
MKNSELLRLAARDLQSLDVPCFFFGGTVVGIHLDMLPSDDEERPTVDVDCVPTGVASRAEMLTLEARLDRFGWRHDLRPDRRNAHARIAPSGVPVDLVPLHTLHDDDPVRLGRSVAVELAPGEVVSILDSAAMVAAKLAAFRDRGSADPLMSHDLEDLTMLLSCCSTIEATLGTADARLRRRVREGLRALRADTFVLEVLDGSVPRGIDSAQVIARVERLSR